jgi:hypothetical protein
MSLLSSVGRDPNKSPRDEANAITMCVGSIVSGDDKKQFNFL